MAYYLRKEKKKKGIYLQMYESHWDKEKKQPRSKSVLAFGYVQDLISDEIPDPVAYYTDFVAEKNKERSAAFAEATRPRAFAAPVEYHLGHFLLYTLLEELNVRKVIDILAAQIQGSGINAGYVACGLGIRLILFGAEHDQAQGDEKNRQAQEDSGIDDFLHAQHHNFCF